MSNFKKTIGENVIKSINNGNIIRANIGVDKKLQQTARFLLDYGVSATVTENGELYVNIHFDKAEYEGIDFNTAVLLAGHDRVRRAEQRLCNEKAKYQELIDTTSKTEKL